MEQRNASTRAAARKKRRMQQRQQTARMLGALLLGVIVLFGIINLLTKDKEFSDSENRILAGKPEFSWSNLKDGTYMREAENYQADQFFARDGWISLKLQEEKFLGRKESNGVYLCRDNYLMEIPQTPDEESVQRNLDAINDFVSRYSDLKFHTLIVPNAVLVMQDYLPKNAPVRDQAADLQQLQQSLNANVGWIDVTAALQQHVEEGIYYHTDHHWTSRGAYYAFLDAADDLGISEELKSYNAYTVSTTFEGTLASKSGDHSTTDTIEVFEPVDPGSEFYVTYDDSQEKSRSLFIRSNLDKKDQYTVFFGGNHPRITIETTNNNDRSLLIFKDSYANCFVQFLTPYYEKIILIDPRYYYDDVGAVISSEEITDVLFLYNLSTYLSDTSLADTLNAAQTPGETATPSDTETQDSGDAEQQEQTDTETQPEQTEED